MKLPLPPRMMACCRLVPPGSRVADVGCDHGYLSIYLLTNHIARSVIASDINAQPLRSAVRNAEKYGVGEQIAFFLSNGVEKIPRDFDCLICAGMGADTMVSILEAAPWLKSRTYTLILQCQSKTPALRRYLSENGWQIRAESVLRDGRFLYTVIKAVWEPQDLKLTAGQWYFPPALLENPPQVLGEYYRRVTKGLRIAVSHRNDPEKSAALRELDSLAEEPTLKWLKEETT